MQNEYERDNGPEDGEYHFSDEGAYESHSEEEEGKAPTVTEKSGLTAQFASYRRFVVLGGIFAGILLVVYLLVTPTSTPPPTEITEATANPAASAEATVATPPVEKAPSPVAEVKPTTPVTPKVERPSAFSKMMASVHEKNKAAAPEAPSVLVSPPPYVEPLPVAAQNLSASLSNVPAQLGSMTTPEMATPPVSMPAAPPMMVASADNAQSSAARLSALQQSNAQMISQLNADYAHKLAEFETQDKVLEEQVRSLNAKVSSMEAQMSQLVQTLNKQQAPPPPPPVSNMDNSNAPGEGNNAVLTLPSSSASSPKSNYTVQAIIPGRAWLRTDSGDTVTVAEGDTLRGMGRVTKIDPYDGTIQIDTGTKVLTLTYGNGDYA